ncbi:hypothetical protein ACQP2U_18250 [Nocardia sp. CA-084685]|uniref:hypothetical protein n=1 Tax=Nocardia sp. CA-084685 TaxID=3239970 RepID=UPI003D97C475
MRQYPVRRSQSRPRETPSFDSPPGWSLSNDKKWKWLDTWLDDTHTPSYYRAAIVPAVDNQPIEYGVSVGITGTLGTETGTLTCLLREHSGADEATLTYKEGSFSMPVDPQAFYVNNFLAFDPGSPNVPRARFSDGDTFVLSGESNGTNFTLYDGDGNGNGNVLYDGPDTSCTLIPPVYPGDQPPAGCIHLALRYPGDERLQHLGRRLFSGRDLGAVQRPGRRAPRSTR